MNAGLKESLSVEEIAELLDFVNGQNSDAFCQLKADGSLHQGSGIFDYGHILFLRELVKVPLILDILIL